MVIAAGRLLLLLFLLTGSNACKPPQGDPGSQTPSGDETPFATETPSPGETPSPTPPPDQSPISTVDPSPSQGPSPTPTIDPSPLASTETPPPTTTPDEPEASPEDSPEEISPTPPGPEESPVDETLEADSPTPEGVDPSPELNSPTPEGVDPSPELNSPTPETSSPTPDDGDESPTETTPSPSTPTPENGDETPDSGGDSPTPVVETPLPSSPPQVESLELTKSTVWSGESTEVVVFVSAPADLPLTYTWTTDGGSISETNDKNPEQVIWTAPVEGGSYSISVTVENSNGEDTASASILVEEVGTGSSITDPSGSYFYPERMAIDEEGKLFVTEPRQKMVFVFSDGGELDSSWSVQGVPSGIAVSPDLGVLVGDRERGGVYCYSASGEPLGSLASSAITSSPVDIAVAPDGTIYIVDSELSKLVAFSAEGLELSQLSIPGAYPVGLDLSADGERIYVSDSNSGQVLIYDPEGNSLGSIGDFGNGEGEMARLAGVVAGPNGRLFLIDSFQARVCVFGADGIYQTSLGSYGSDAGELNLPIDGLIDSSGRLAISSPGNGRIELFDIPSDLRAPAPIGIALASMRHPRVERRQARRASIMHGFEPVLNKEDVHRPTPEEAEGEAITPGPRPRREHLHQRWEEGGPREEFLPHLVGWRRIARFLLAGTLVGYCPDALEDDREDEDAGIPPNGILSIQHIDIIELLSRAIHEFCGERDSLSSGRGGDIWPSSDEPWPARPKGLTPSATQRPNNDRLLDERSILNRSTRRNRPRAVEGNLRR